jgi:hypothetical protein
VASIRTATITDRAGTHTVTSVIIGSTVSACPSRCDEQQALLTGDLVNLTHTKLIAVVRAGNESELPHDSDLHVDDRARGTPPGRELHTK